MAIDWEAARHGWTERRLVPELEGLGAFFLVAHPATADAVARWIEERFPSRFAASLDERHGETIRLLRYDARRR